MADLTDATLVPMVQAALRDRTNRMIEDFIQKSVKDFEAELRKTVASAALDVSQFIEMHSDRHGVNITISLKDRRHG